MSPKQPKEMPAPYYWSTYDPGIEFLGQCFRCHAPAMLRQGLCKDCLPVDELAFWGDQELDPPVPELIDLPHVPRFVDWVPPPADDASPGPVLGLRWLNIAPNAADINNQPPRQISFAYMSSDCAGCREVEVFGGICRECFPHGLVLRACAQCLEEHLFPYEETLCDDCRIPGPL